VPTRRRDSVVGVEEGKREEKKKEEEERGSRSIDESQDPDWPFGEAGWLRVNMKQALRVNVKHLTQRFGPFHPTSLTLRCSYHDRITPQRSLQNSILLLPLM
jgi:hypothetical protein